MMNVIRILDFKFCSGSCCSHKICYAFKEYIYLIVDQGSKSGEASGAFRVQNLRRCSLSGASPALAQPLESMPP